MSARIYTKREPLNTVLHKALSTYVDNCFAEVESQDQTIPKFVRSEFEAILKCGLLIHGFLRMGCFDCKTERLVSTSCKKSGFCSSCGKGRQAEFTEYVTESAFVDVPVR